MPPPLLSRHFRPCRCPWSARQAHHASSTAHARAKLSNGGSDDGHAVARDDADKTPEGDHGANRGWWNSAIMQTLGFRKVQSTTGTEASPLPTAAVAGATAEEEAAAAATTKTTTTRDTTPRASAVERAVDAADVQPRSQTENNADFQVRRLGTSQYNRAVDLRAAHIAAKIYKRTAEAERHTGQTTPPAADRLEQPTVQEQIQELFEQVRMLKVALEEATAKAKLRPDPGTQAVTNKARGDASQGQSSTVERPPPPSTVTPSPAHSVMPAVQPSARTQIRVLRNSAWKCYRNTITTLIDIAEQPGMSRMNAPLITEIQRYLTAAGRDAVIRKDRRVIEELSRYTTSPALNVILRLPFFEREHRQSAVELGKIAVSLNDTTSPSVARLATMIRARLATMVSEALAVNDNRMSRALANLKTLRLEESSTRGPSGTMTTLSTGVELKTIEDGRKASRASGVSPDTTILPKHQAKNETKKNKRKAKKRTNMPPEPQPGPADEVVSSIRPEGHVQEKLDASNTIPGDVRPGEHSDPTATHTLDHSPTTTDLSHSKPAPSSTDEVNDQSLLEELFPEASVPRPVSQPEMQKRYPKLDLPEPASPLRTTTVSPHKSLKEQVIESFEKSGERITVLQLEHCSTQLTESDFRRLIPKGKHIEAWNSDGAFYKVIPGRDPISLERLPFYYILFKSPQAAHAYQKNVGRLHKLAALHQPANLFSAIPAPKGFLEDGEDVNGITSSYFLKPTEHALSLRMLMQPYHPSLRALFEAGGYKPIVSDRRDRSYKVLMHMEGYEPSPSDFFKTIRRDAWLRGMSLTLRNESSSSIHRLRDLVNLKTRTSPISTSNPRAFGHMQLEFDDQNIGYFMNSEGPINADNAREINQFVMNRVYNRWILEFDDDDEARRFAISWHRRLFPDLLKGEKTWKDYEEPRMCNCELLW